MPRDRKVVKVVDAIRGQQRVILWLEGCPHKISITDKAWLAQPDHLRPTVGEVVQCPHCPDPPPQDERLEKSATRLWREAGEP